jgi:hypothetical protein
MNKPTDHLSVVAEIAVAPLSDIEQAVERAVARAFATQPDSGAPAVMTTAQTAKYLGATEAWVRLQIREGHLSEAAPSNRRRLLVTRRSVERLLRDV